MSLKKSLTLILALLLVLSLPVNAKDSVFQDGGAELTNDLIIQEGGRIGIGTNDPQQELDIEGSASITGPVSAQRIILPDTQTDGANTVQTSGDDKDLRLNGERNIELIINEQNQYLDSALNVYPDGPGGTPLFRVQNNGNVGIGVGNATVALDVNGQVKSTGLCIGEECITDLTGIGTTPIDAPGETTGASLLPPNLIRNSYMNIIDGSGAPAGYSYNTNSDITLQAVHPFTKCFEGPYTETAPANAVANCEDATQSTPYWFSRYNKGPRIWRGGLADGWNDIPDGRILKISGSNSKSHSAVFLPFERNVMTDKVLIKGWIKITKGEMVGFGTGSGWETGPPDNKGTNGLKGLKLTKEETQNAPQGWFKLNHVVSLSQITNLNAFALSLGIVGEGNDKSFEVYLALPYIANVNYESNTWLPSVSDMLMRDGLFIHPTSNKVGIRTINPEVSLHVKDAGSNAKLKLQSDGDDYNYAGVVLSSNDNKLWEIAHRKIDPNTNKLMFFHYNGATWNHRMTFEPEGNVGIGKEDPLTKLDVAGSGQFEQSHSSTSLTNSVIPALRVVNSDTTDRNYARVEFIGSDINGVNRIGTAMGTVFKNRQSNWPYYDSDFFWTTQSATQGRQNIPMYLTASGNLGLSTTSPEYYLDIRRSGDKVLHLGNLAGQDFIIDVAGGQGLVNLIAGARVNTDPGDDDRYVFTGTRGASRIRMHDDHIAFYISDQDGQTGAIVEGLQADEHKMQLSRDGSLWVQSKVDSPSLCINGDCKTSWEGLGGGQAATSDPIYLTSSGQQDGIKLDKESNAARNYLTFTQGTGLNSWRLGQTTWSDGLALFVGDADPADPGAVIQKWSIDGNVGIGTDSPAYLLDIATTTDKFVNIQGTGETGLRFDNGDAYITVHDGFGNFNILSGVNEDNIIVGDEDGGTRVALEDRGAFSLELYDGAQGATAVSANRFYVGKTLAYFENTNVGIKTTEPEATLHVVDTGGSEFAIEREHASAGEANQFNFIVDNTDLHIRPIDRNGDLIFADRTFTGNVGIGKTPSEKLDVNGKVQATDFCIGTNCMSSLTGGTPGGGSCPTGYTDMGDFCIETNEHEVESDFDNAIPWEEALDECHQDQASLCTLGQWVMACNNGGGTLSAMTGNFEYVDETYGRFNRVVVGGSNCQDEGETGRGGSFPFRCCKSK